MWGLSFGAGSKFSDSILHAFPLPHLGRTSPTTCHHHQETEPTHEGPEPQEHGSPRTDAKDRHTESPREKTEEAPPWLPRPAGQRF